MIILTGVLRTFRRPRAAQGLEGQIVWGKVQAVDIFVLWVPSGRWLLTVPEALNCAMPRIHMHRCHVRAHVWRDVRAYPPVVLDDRGITG